MENELNITLKEYIEQLGEINNKLSQTASATKNASSANKDANVQFLATQTALKAIGNIVPGLSSALQTYSAVTKIWGDVTKTSAQTGSKAMNLFNKSLGAIGIVITVCSALFEAIKERIDSSAEATAKFREIMAKLEPIMKIANSALEVTVDVLLKIIDAGATAVNWLGKVFSSNKKGYKDATAQAKEYAKLENEIAKEERKRIEERGKSEAKQGKLREQIAKAEGQNKIKLLNDLKDEIKLQTDAEIALNKKRIALMEYKQSLGPTSEAEKKALAQLKSETDKLIGDQGRQLARIEKQIKATNTNMASASTKAVKDAAEEAKKALREYVKERDRILSGQSKSYSGEKSILSAERALEDARLKLTIRTEDEKLQAKRDRLTEDIKLENDYYNKQKKALEDTINSGKLDAEALAKYKQQLEDLTTEHLVNQYKFQTESYNIEAEKQTAILNRELEKRKYDRESLSAEYDNSYYTEQVEEAEKEHQEKMDKLQETIYGSMDMMMSQFDMLNEPQQMLFDSITATIGQISTEIDTFKQLGDGQQNAANKTKMAMKVIGQATQAAMAVTSKFMATKRQQIQQDLEAGKISEEQAKKEFEKTKKVEIAMAIMSTLGGIAGAIPAFIKSSIPMPAAAILGGALAATIAATGAMQIAQIKATTLDTDGSVSSSTPSVSFAGATVNPLLNEQYDQALVNQQAVVQGDSATTDQRVYIVESDIQESNKRVEIRENNTTF